MTAGRTKKGGQVPRELLALGRLKTGQMNQTEAAYAAHLRLRERAGEIVWWKFEAVKLRLADLTFYSPDFLVMRATGELELHEVKGARHLFLADARVKCKVVADQYPFRVIAVYPRDRVFSGWDIEEF